VAEQPVDIVRWKLSSELRCHALFHLLVSDEGWSRTREGEAKTGVPDRIGADLQSLALLLGKGLRGSGARVHSAPEQTHHVEQKENEQHPERNFDGRGGGFGFPHRACYFLY